MGQFSVEKPGLPGSVLSGNQQTDHLDLYLLHWRDAVPLAETVEGMEALVSTGKIRRWGVSNFDTADMEALLRTGGEHCATNQILYNVTKRGVEFDLLPFLMARRIPTMANSPLGQGDLPPSKALASIARQLEESWLRRTGQFDKWIFCLTAA